MTAVVYIGIGNSDDKLSQAQWSEFVTEVSYAIQQTGGYPGGAVHGEWFSPCGARWQNACWCLQLPDNPLAVEALKIHLRHLAGQYEQDSIAWAQAPATEFLSAT